MPQSFVPTKTAESHEKMALDVAIAIFGLAFSILFEVVSIQSTEAKTLNKFAEIRQKLRTPDRDETKDVSLNNELSDLSIEISEKVLAVQGDLWFTGFSLFLGAAVASLGTTQSSGVSRSTLIIQVLAFVVILLFILALPLFGDITDQTALFNVILPDLVGLGALTYAVTQVRKIASIEGKVEPRPMSHADGGESDSSSGTTGEESIAASGDPSTPGSKTHPTPAAPAPATGSVAPPAKGQSHAGDKLAAKGHTDGGGSDSSSGATGEKSVAATGGRSNEGSEAHEESVPVASGQPSGDQPSDGDGSGRHERKEPGTT